MCSAYQFPNNGSTETKDKDFLQEVRGNLSSNPFHPHVMNHGKNEKVAMAKKALAKSPRGR